MPRPLGSFAEGRVPRSLSDDALQESFLSHSRSLRRESSRMKGAMRIPSPWTCPVRGFRATSDPLIP
jgi:hypothetical protein